ncbi:MAG: glycosyltransferase family 4 protein [Tissierellia bacterium]|nr:glycosyltransferase family 4 protein [Tissierellia bacterium]
MHKISINMSYTGDKIEGQGVGAATHEQINLIKDTCADCFDVYINKNKKTDIIHIHTIDPMSFLRMNLIKAKKVIHVHFLPETLEGSIKLPKFMMGIFHKYFLSMYRNADKIVVVNPIFISELEKYNIDRSKINYIPNFVSEESFYQLPPEEKLSAKDKFEISKDSFTVLGVGQVQTRKGVLDFVKIAEALPHINFVWAGGFSFGAITDGYSDLKKITENPPPNVKFLGIIPRNEMNELYNASDLLFMPSYNELFPMAILEACSSGLPILLRNLELYEDILFEKYVNGFDNDSFVDEIRKLSTDKQYYSDAINNSNYISNYYSRENVRKIWIDFYQSI